MGRGRVETLGPIIAERKDMSNRMFWILVSILLFLGIGIAISLKELMLRGYL